MVVATYGLAISGFSRIPIGTLTQVFQDPQQRLAGRIGDTQAMVEMTTLRMAAAPDHPGLQRRPGALRQSVG